MQLAEEYDRSGLEGALANVAKDRRPFEMRTVGLLLNTGSWLGVMVAPDKDRAISEFQAAAWEIITPFAQGRADDFYHPDHWLPHVTIKRMGNDAEAFGRGLATLARHDFHWSTTIDTIAVQHDPGGTARPTINDCLFRSAQARLRQWQPKPTQMPRS